MQHVIISGTVSFTSTHGSYIHNVYMPDVVAGFIDDMTDVYRIIRDIVERGETFDGVIIIVDDDDVYSEHYTYRHEYPIDY